MFGKWLNSQVETTRFHPRSAYGISKSALPTDERLCTILNK